MKIVPVGENVVVKPIEMDETTAGGIILPDAAGRHSQQGRVLSVGDGCRLADGSHAAPQVNEGDRIFFNPHSGAGVVVDGEELLILREGEVLAIVR